MYRAGLGGGQQGWQGFEEKVPGCNVGKYQITNSLGGMGTDGSCFSSRNVATGLAPRPAA